MTGLDWRALLDVLPAGFDRERLIHLARCYELGLIQGTSELLPRPKG